jgi:hypothetical protein
LRAVNAPRCILFALILTIIAPRAFAADPGLTWKFEGDSADLPENAKSDLDHCLVVAKDIVAGAADRVRVSAGIHTDRTGRAVDVAIVESSGIKQLDAWVAGCLRSARFKPPPKPAATDYRLVRLDLTRKPHEVPTQCVPGMHTDVALMLRPPPGTPPEQMPEDSEAIVCGCLSEDAVGPTPPVILSSSNVARVDAAAVGLMKQTAAERWRTPFGCTAWKVRIER